MRRTRAAVLALIGLLAGVARAGASPVQVPAPAAPAPAAASPGDSLTVYLMTMGPGRLVWERFGHNAIWIHDPVRGTDLTYNYGLFDFRQENFILRFIQGRMWYWMDGFPAERYVAQYRRANRSVWVQELNIPPEARRELQAFLEWNARPENRYYHYDYYRDNCSTRVRDALDRALGGRLQANTVGRPTGTTYRFHTQRLTANDPLIYTGLLAALGPGVDRPISEWEEMFLPMKLREHIREVTVEGPDGHDIPLVKSEHTLFESTAPAPPDAPPSWLLGYLAVGLALGAVLLGLARLGTRSRIAGIGFAALAGAWALVIGLAGLVLTGLWAFTDHVMAYRNENLFQANPLALALVMLVPVLISGTRWAIRPTIAVAWTVAALSALGLVLKLFPAFDQVNGQIIALTLPVHLALAAGIVLLTREVDRKRPHETKVAAEKVVVAT